MRALTIRQMIRGPFVWVAVLLFGFAAADEDNTLSIDPATWGADHVGKKFPMFVTGDECLFCHRKIGPTWPENTHQLTIRPATPEEAAIKAIERLPVGNTIAKQADFLLGAKRTNRLLKRSVEYGKMEILSASFVQENQWHNTDNLHWDKNSFGDRCAGCHSTAVDVETKAFSAISLDCFVCHGDVSLEHTKDISRVLLSSKNQEARETISICGQCHLRGGRSKSSGLPYPNTFVAGDNLFRDFKVDFSKGSITKMSPVDQHIYQNSRAVVVAGNSMMTCLTCHNVHEGSSDKHQELSHQQICSTCHLSDTENLKLTDSFVESIRSRGTSAVCDLGM